MISFPNSLSTKQEKESKRKKTKTFVFVEALTKPFRTSTVLTMGSINFLLGIFFGGVL